MKKITVLASAALLLYSCSKNDSLQTADQSVNNPSVAPKGDINNLIKRSLETTGKFDWSTAPDEIIWSALEQSDHIASIGYKPASELDISTKMATIDINAKEWLAAKQAILKIVLEEESKMNSALTANNIEVWQEGVLPVVYVEIKNIATIKRLRASNLIRYVEPMGYEPDFNPNPFLESDSGCGSNTANNDLVNGVHYTTQVPNNNKVSWNYSLHGITSAWTKSTGAGVKVFIIDSGVEYDQENLAGSFNQGSSSGRTLERIVTLPRATFLGIPTGPVETPDDGCGHGTSMAGAAAAPRGTDGNMCGVAYNCNLVTCRAATDVYLSSSRENKGVADAYTNAANRADVKIISMSMGRLTSSGQITDAIRYAKGKGKLMFCAGGTSFSFTGAFVGVIFPAYLPEVQAVTGVKQNTAFTRCDACHKGSEIDFAVIMERAGDNFHPLSLAMSGDTPSTVGGSSVATATCAGMAALVWSRFPTLTADQVVTKLAQSSSNYTNKTADFGWGTPNVNIATN